MEGAALQSNKAFVHQLFTAVDEASNLGAIFFCLRRNACEIGFVGLTKVGGVGTRHGASFTHPGNRSRGIKTSGKCNSDAFAYGEGGEYLRHSFNGTAE